MCQARLSAEEAPGAKPAQIPAFMEPPLSGQGVLGGGDYYPHLQGRKLRLGGTQSLAWHHVAQQGLSCYTAGLESPRGFALRIPHRILRGPR